MKKLLALTLLVATIGCTETKTTPAVVEPEPHFAYLQEVTIYRGFLKGQTGKIVSYKVCNENTPEAYVCYTVKLNVQPAEGQGDTWNNISERDLTP